MGTETMSLPLSKATSQPGYHPRLSPRGERTKREANGTGTGRPSPFLFPMVVPGGGERTRTADLCRAKAFLGYGLTCDDGQTRRWPHMIGCDGLPPRDPDS